MKAFCIGRNFVEHTKELQNAIPDEPVVFIKPADCFFTASDKRIELDAAPEIHYEAEIVVRFAESIHHNTHKERSLLECLDATTIGIDFTNRKKQEMLKRKGLPWEKAKSFCQSAFLGEWLDIKKYVSIITALQFQLEINGNIVQNGCTKDMIWDIEELIQHLAAYFPINAGDVLFGGTPKGVGVVHRGDKLKGTLEGTTVFDFYY